MEYLSPGVYIEELPPRLRAIEGVSTSTVGMAGPSPRGPVPGEILPFIPESGPAGLTISLPRDSSPRLITSYSEFVRIFGDPLPMPDPNGNAFLGRAVRSFFDNGGKRVYISRVINWTAAPIATDFDRSAIQTDQGPVIHLRQPAQSIDTEIFLNSLRGINIGTAVMFQRRSDGVDVLGGALNVADFNTVAGSITFAAAIGQDLDPADVYIQTGAVSAGDGPVFHARSPGSWGDALRVLIRPADRGPVEITAPATGSQIRVQSTGGFYRGAIIEIDDGSTRDYREITDILPGNILQIDTAIGAPLNDPIDPATAVNTPYVRVVGIDVVITDESGSEPVTEVYNDLTWNPAQRLETRRRYYAEVINNRSRLVYVQPPAWDGHGGTQETASLATQPITGNGGPADNQVNGFETTGVTTPGADAYGLLTPGDYAGTTGPVARTGLEALMDVDDISIIACPGQTAAVVQNAMITQCERLRYRFAVLDADFIADTVTAVLTHRNLYDTSYAGYYHPWVEQIENNQQVFLPPSGHLCGIYARVDNERGVYKAPANEVVRGITGLRQYVVEAEQDILNPRGVNVIRQFSGRGIRVWGARTLSSDPSLRYISTRRFLIFLEKSLDRGTQWVVFEPNNPDTWGRVTDAVSAFLHTQWRSGALLGRTPEQAFFVRCDESTMTADDIENGRLICNIGIAITKPAEFVIFRIEQITAFGEGN